MTCDTIAINIIHIEANNTRKQHTQTTGAKQMKNLKATLNNTRGYENLTAGKAYEIITFDVSYSENCLTFQEYFSFYNDASEFTTLHASRFSVDATTREALNELAEKFYIDDPDLKPCN